MDGCLVVLFKNYQDLFPGQKIIIRLLQPVGSKLCVFTKHNNSCDILQILICEKKVSRVSTVL